MLPNRITLSKLATGKLQYIKNKTGVTPNILARIAIMRSIEDESSLTNAGVEDSDGQVLGRDVLFGDHSAVYDVVINQFIHDKKIEHQRDRTTPCHHHGRSFRCRPRDYCSGPRGIGIYQEFP